VYPKLILGLTEVIGNFSLLGNGDWSCWNYIQYSKNADIEGKFEGTIRVAEILT
jgi:hypothetical protein